MSKRVHYPLDQRWEESSILGMTTKTEKPLCRVSFEWISLIPHLKDFLKDPHACKRCKAALAKEKR